MRGGTPRPFVGYGRPAGLDVISQYQRLGARAECRSNGPSNRDVEGPRPQPHWQAAGVARVLVTILEWSTATYPAGAERRGRPQRRTHA